jgi:hypothetical protein
VDRREPVVAGLGCVVAGVFEVVEEGGDHGRVELRDVEFAGRGACPVGREPQQQLEGVAVGGDRVLAGLVLGEQAVGEIGLQ